MCTFPSMLITMLLLTFPIVHSSKCTAKSLLLSADSSVVFSASESRDADSTPNKSNIHTSNTEWIPNSVIAPSHFLTSTAWLQIDLGIPMKIASVSTFIGGSNIDSFYLADKYDYGVTRQRVIRYSLAYSNYSNNESFIFYPDDFNGKLVNDDTASVSVLNSAIFARYVRFYPLYSWYRTSMRVDVAGCNASCTDCVVPKIESNKTVIECVAAYDSCNTTINCVDGIDCEVYCVGDEACGTFNAIYCPSNAKCRVYCYDNELYAHACYYITIYCGSSTECRIEAFYFLYGVIHCPLGDILCSFYSFWSGLDGVCSPTIYGGGGDLIYYGSTKHGLTIYCPVNKECNITARDRRDGYGTVKIYASESKTLNINLIESAGFQEVYIECPSDGIRGNNTHNCNIDVEITVTYYGAIRTDVLDYTYIVADEGVNDINIRCKTPCFTDEKEPMVRCAAGVHTATYCSIHPIDEDYTQDSEWECIDPTNECYQFLLPTAIPTAEPSLSPTYAPTTLIPTESPTKAYPFDSEHTVYVRKHNSCDYGLCRKETGNYNSYCSDPLNWTLSISEETPCFTMLYALNCLNGITGYPTNKTDCNDYYDGEGVIDVGEGSFDLITDIHIVYKPQSIKGVDKISTTLYHNDGDINCEKQCFFKLSDMQYTSLKNSSDKINVYNKGHAYFENVVFYANTSGYHLVFNVFDGAYVEFAYCRFHDINVQFNIVNDARVIFGECIFEANLLSFNIESKACVTFTNTDFSNNYAVNTSNSMINIKSSTLLVEQCLFYNNHHFHALFDNTNGTNDNIEITHSKFKFNININHIFYTLNSITLLSNTTSIRYCIMYQNNCSHYGCIYVLNGNLNIDEFSITERETSTEPTTGPTPSPTPSLITPTDIIYCGYRLAHWVPPFIMFNYRFILTEQQYVTLTCNMVIRLFDANWESINVKNGRSVVILDEGVYYVGFGSTTYAQGPLHVFIDCSSLAAPSVSPTIQTTPTINSTSDPTAIGRRTELLDLTTFIPSSGFHDFYPFTDFGFYLTPCGGPCYRIESSSIETYVDLDGKSNVSLHYEGYNFDCYDYSGMWIKWSCDTNTITHEQKISETYGEMWVYHSGNIYINNTNCALLYIRYEASYSSGCYGYVKSISLTYDETPTSSYSNHPTSLLPTSLLPTSLLPTSLLPTSLLPTSLLPTSLFPTQLFPTSEPRTTTSFYPIPTVSSTKHTTLSSAAHPSDPTSSTTTTTTTTTTKTSLYPIPTVSPTKHPTISSAAPSFAPTEVTQKLLYFGRTINYTDPIELYLYEFDAGSIKHKIELLNFGYQSNDIIQFEPCLPFETYSFDDISFNTLASSYIPNYVFTTSGAFYRNTLNCDDTLLCFVQCTNATLTCFGSTFHLSNTLDAVLVNCDTESSCEDNTITISSSNGISAVKCGDTFSCKGATIYVNKTDDFILECVASESCINLNINITASVDTKIVCFDENACQSMRVFSTSNELDIFMYNFNDDVTVIVPSEYNQTKVHCNPNQAYLLLDSYPSYKSLNDSAKTLFGGDMPCSGLFFEFYDVDKPGCSIRYSFETYVSAMRDFDPQYMSCYHPDSPIFIDDIVEFDCLGTDAPTIDPTSDPTVDPTTDPTVDPTTDPTIDPTVAPTADPTAVPTLDPTLSPTRVPTVSNAYNSFFVIQYLILNLKQQHIDYLVTDAQTVSDTITDIIEKSYSEETGLFLQFFWLEVEEILGFKVKDIHMAEYPQFLKSQNEIPLNCTIKCNTDSCDILLTPQFQASFQLQAQSKLRDYFGDIIDSDADADSSQILFEISGDTDDIEVKTLDVSTSSIWDNEVLVGSFLIFTVSLMMSLAALAHNKQQFCFCKETVMDNARWIAFVVYGLQMIDFASDINLSLEMVFSDRVALHKLESMDIVTICALLSIIFILLPYCVNLFFAIRIKRRIPKENKMAISYFNSRVLFFVFLMIFCGGCFPALSMVSSGVFGLRQLNSGLTSFELKKMNRIKMIGTIWLENIPQLMIQVLYANAIEDISPNTAFSFVASALSILVVVTSYLIERTDENITTFTYYIHVKKAKNDGLELDGCLIDDEKKAFIVNKGRTEGLCKALCGSFGCNYKDIEVSTNSEITDVSLILYVIHHTHSHINLRMIEKVYEKASVCRKFREYFHLSTNFIVEFKRTTRDDNVSADKQDFTDAMKRLMNRKSLNWNSVESRKDFLSTYMDSMMINTSIQTIMEDSDEIISNVASTKHDRVELQAMIQIKSVSTSAQSAEVNENNDDDAKLQSNLTKTEDDALSQTATAGGKITTDDVKERDDDLNDIDIDIDEVCDILTDLEEDNDFFEALE